MNFFQTSPDDPQGIMSRLMGNPQGGGGESIFSRLASGFEGAAPWLAYAQASPDQAAEVLNTGLRTNMLRDAKRKEQEEKIRKQRALMGLLGKHNLDPSLADVPEVAQSALNRAMTPKEPKQLTEQERLLGMMNEQQRAAYINKQAGIEEPLAQQPITGPDGQPVPVFPGQDPKIIRQKVSEAQAAQVLPPDPKNVGALRKEVQDLPSYKNLAQAAPVYRSMVDAAGRDTRAADVNLIYGMAKVMDPTSVVRESEMTVAQAIATLPQQLRATVESQFTSTGRLSPQVRAALMQEAQSRVNSYKTMFDQDAGMYRGIVQRGRMNEADVLPSFGDLPEYKPQKSDTPTPALPNKTQRGVPWGVKGNKQSSANDGRFQVAEADPVVRPGSDEEFQMRLNQSLNDPLQQHRVWPDVNRLQMKPPVNNDNGLWPPRARV
jgi:hypothetical protein